MDDIKDAVDAAGKKFRKNLVLLHCTSEYPADISNLNLRFLITLRDYFNVPVGYSDHSRGIEIAIAARALGACIIEKHFTLSKELEGPDHKASLEPDEFKQMVNYIRNVESALGNGIKRPSKIEIANRDVVWRSIVASKDLPKGHRIRQSDLSVKRPGTGLRPKYIKDITGSILKKSIKKNGLIRWKDIQK